MEQIFTEITRFVAIIFAIGGAIHFFDIFKKESFKNKLLVLLLVFGFGTMLIVIGVMVIYFAHGPHEIIAFLNFSESNILEGKFIFIGLCFCGVSILLAILFSLQKLIANFGENR